MTFRNQSTIARKYVTETSDHKVRRLLLIPIVAFASLAQNPNVTKNAIGIEFVKIAPGEFMMGCLAGDTDCDADEKPLHRVQITKAFEIGKYELTQVQWQAVMGSNPSTIKGDDHPVETVSKNEVHDFLARLNARNDGYRYRLPTEAEWEYAARAGTSAAPPESLDEVAWYAANSDDETHPVGQKKPNAWGLYDMLGNVREWVEDVYLRGYYGNSPLADPTGPEAVQPEPDRRGNFGRGGRMRQLPVVRGGGWDNAARFVRFSARYHYYGPTLRVSDIGFRVVREPL
jgi:formylglycine-generating enzyme required for sulfatase activity